MTQRAMTLPCPAKLNVFLEVVGKRSDGYHELDTVMLRTKFADQLSLRDNDTGTLTLRFSDSTPEAIRGGIPLDSKNLILRAAESFKNRMSLSWGGEFILHKRIPPESGLAGGSSNAATALFLCRRMWCPEVPDDVLHEIAASLGSDINFLLSGHAAAVCRGRGEILQPIKLHRRPLFVALRPDRGNSTPEIFRHTALSSTPISSDAIVNSLTNGGAEKLTSHIFNRLTDAAMKVNSEMATLIQRLKGVTRQPVFMSGSGSTVFLVANSMPHARDLQAEIMRTLHRRSWLLETEHEV